MKSFLFALKLRIMCNMLRYKSPSFKEDHRLTSPEEVIGGILFFVIQIAGVLKHRSSRTWIYMFVYLFLCIYSFCLVTPWDSGTLVKRRLPYEEIWWVSFTRSLCDFQLLIYGKRNLAIWMFSWKATGWRQSLECSTRERFPIR